jgi:hypothetical protein
MPCPIDAASRQRAYASASSGRARRTEASDPAHIGHRLREIALAGTDLARATAATVRVRLPKIGAAIVRNSRRVRLLLASHHPLRALLLHAARALTPRTSPSAVHGTMTNGARGMSVLSQDNAPRITARALAPLASE